MQLLTTRALVLRETRYKETDKMLTVLTESEGKLGLRVRGALRRGSKVAAATQFLAYSEMTLFGSRGRWTLNEAETLEQFLPLREDIGKLALGAYFAELMEAVGDEDSPNPALLRLGLNALYAVSRGLYAPEHVKAAFELRLMCLSGYEPMLERCGVCGEVNITHPMFRSDAGFLHCDTCKLTDTIQNPPPSLPLCEASLAAMRYVVGSELRRVFAFTLDDPQARARFYAAAERYVQVQLERGFGALDYWKQMTQLTGNP